MTDDEKDKIALFRYSTFSDLITGIDDSKSKHAFFRSKAEKQWINPEGKTITISEETIERWYYRYLKYGFDGLRPTGRNDAGLSRKLDNDIIEVIQYYVENHPRMPATLIYDELINKGYIQPDDVSVATIQRYVRRIKDKEVVVQQAEMKRYEAEHINDIWCCDTTYSFKLTVNGEKKRTFIIAIIDDASRMIVGIDVFFNDNYVNFLSVLKSAVRRAGKPSVLNLDYSEVLTIPIFLKCA